MLRRLTLIVIPALCMVFHSNAQVGDTAGVRKPLQWTLTDDYTTETSTDPDTAFSLFHRYRKTDKFSPFNAFTGNYGQPLYQVNFFDRITDP
ncbi:MAG TPA: hypothetical protein PL040_11435, partial [Bacteroidales bacterium]|nr:hypothetical protein [Bacteroidales bacterium]